jgi:NTE family protein
VTTIKGPKIGIALGGGSSRGLMHIPFVEAMDEMGLRPSVIAGTSIGSLVGAGWAAGLKGKEIREHSIEVLGSMRSITSRLWKNKLKDLRHMFKNGISMQFDPLDIVTAFLPDDFPKEFEGLRTPLYIIATDFRSWHQVIFHSGEILPAIAGSIAIPSLFQPVEFDGRLLVDGGVVNPLPVDSASIGTDLTIAIDVNGDPSKRTSGLDPSAIDITLGSAQIMMHSLTAHNIAAYPPDLYIRPNVKEFGAYEYWRVREIIEEGEKEKEHFKRQLAKLIEDFIVSQRKIF